MAVYIVSESIDNNRRLLHNLMSVISYETLKSIKTFTSYNELEKEVKRYGGEVRTLDNFLFELNEDILEIDHNYYYKVEIKEG